MLNALSQRLANLITLHVEPHVRLSTGLTAMMINLSTALTNDGIRTTAILTVIILPYMPSNRNLIFNEVFNHTTKMGKTIMTYSVINNSSSF